jgi:LmbE family N-acetylglucosaminyl deacetylase
LKPDSGSSWRIVVVSPHLDDGVLSLGAAMAGWGRDGARVELLTVFACDPDSTARAGGWDARAGHATEGESARARRDEDGRACAHLGATPSWLPFGSVDYDRHGTDEEVRAAVLAEIAGADEVLLPWFPLSHPDHALLADLLSNADLGLARVGEYAEQPYAKRHHDGAPSRFRPVRSRSRDRLAKWRAVREYRSQLPLLGMVRSIRRGPLAVSLGPETIAWRSDPLSALSPGGHRTNLPFR